jgi:hypothetical protein
MKLGRPELYPCQHLAQNAMVITQPFVLVMMTTSKFGYSETLGDLNGAIKGESSPFSVNAVVSEEKPLTI